MKKIIYAAIAAIGLWLSPGCSNEEELLGSGDEAQVSFTVNLADGIQTKAIADGTTAKNLVVGVFEKVGESYQEITGLRKNLDNKFASGLSTTVDFKLMKGKSYSFIFWAQSQSVETTVSSPYYDLTDLQDIKVSYAGAKANDESRDAFLGVVKDYEVTRDFTEEVKLKRPFAQLNFMVTKEELDKAAAAGLTIRQSSITLSQVAQKLQPLKGTVSDYLENVAFAAKEVSINMTDITASENKQTLPTYEGSSETTYYYLATTYFLVAANDEALEEPGKARATLASANMKIKDAEGNGLTANSVPVQWNYRTNIYGPLLTAPGTFMVEIKEEFNGDYNEYQESVTVNAISEVAAAIERGATTITVKDAPTSDVPIEIPKVVDGDNKNITLNLPALGTSTITIKEQTTGDEAGKKIPAKVNVNTTSADNVVINLPNSTVTLNGGTYSNVTATTADETLIVSEGVTITNLVVQKGKVRIMKGGKVGTITRATGNEDEKTYVYIEDGELENLPTDEKIIVQATIASASAFKSALETACSTVGDHTVSISGDIDFTDVSFLPLSVDGYHGVGVITIEGNGHTFTGLKDALFAGGFAGTSGIVIRNLTIDGKNQPITPQKLGGESGWGYFIKNIDSMPTISLENCHLKNADITITDDLRVGGLIGWTAGYNNENDGPVKTYVTITNCSVTNCSITAKGSVGAIIGHAGSNPATYHTITGCTVTNCTLHSTDDGDWRVGVVVGTANEGQVTISGTTERGNILTQVNKTAPEGQSNLYGRFVPNTTGKLTIDGVEITN